MMHLVVTVSLETCKYLILALASPAIPHLYYVIDYCYVVCLISLLCHRNLLSTEHQLMNNHLIN